MNFKVISQAWAEVVESLKKFPKLPRKDKIRALKYAAIPAVLFLVFMGISIRDVRDKKSAPLYSVTPSSVVVTPVLPSLVGDESITEVGDILTDDDYMLLYRDSQNVAKAIQQQKPELIENKQVQESIRSGLADVELVAGKLTSGEIQDVSFTETREATATMLLAIRFDLEDGERYGTLWDLTYARSESGVWTLESIRNNAATADSSSAQEELEDEDAVAN